MVSGEHPDRAGLDLRTNRMGHGRAVARQRHDRQPARHPHGAERIHRLLSARPDEGDPQPGLLHHRHLRIVRLRQRQLGGDSDRGYRGPRPGAETRSRAPRLPRGDRRDASELSVRHARRDAVVTDGVRAATDVVAKRLGKLKPRAAIVLGSGLAGVAEAASDAVRIPYKEIPGFPEPGAPGHKGELVGGTLEGVPVLVPSGRFHVYVGHAPAVAALPTRVFARLGVRTLIVTNAAGGIRRTFRPPTPMLIADHINLMFRNPLVGSVEPGEERFPDMSDPYDPELRACARDVARAERMALEEGVYAALLCPSFETPAEIRMLERLGADAVGMSTVPEVIAARARGMRCLGFSSVTNVAAGLSAQKLSHGEVLEAGARVAGQLERLIRGVLT